VRGTLIIVLGLSLSSCRAEHDRLSGQPYACERELAQSEDEPTSFVGACSLDAGEAIELARQCLTAAGIEARFCFCNEDTITWCDLDTCKID